MDKNVLADQELAQADLSKMLNSQEGRRFIRRRLQECNVFSPMPVSDPMTFAMQEGKRQVGLALFWQVVACGPNYITMLIQENMNNV